MKTNIKTNHLLVTSVLNSDGLKQLMEDPYVAGTGIGSLKYGWATVVLYTWLNHLVTLQSQMLLTIDKDTGSFESKADKLYSYALQSVVYEDAETPVVLGGNIIINKHIRLTKKAMRSALKLSLGTHPLCELLESSCMLSKSKKIDVGINKICSRDLSEIIQAIDFEIPSISYMLKTLGFNYIVTQPYLQNDIVISNCQEDPQYLCILYGANLTKYKRVMPEQLASLAAENRLNLPMYRMEAMTSRPPIMTNDYE